MIWEFDQARYLSTAVVPNDALVGVTSEDAWRFDNYFRGGIYAILRSNVGD